MNVIRNGRFRETVGAVVLVFYIWLASGKISAAPHFEVDQPLWNFGTATNVSALVHDFVIRNSGDAPLEIHRVISSCGACLRVSIGQTNLPPGGSTVLRGRLDLRLLSDAISRAILVECNDPQNPSCVLELAGVVMPVYQVEPPEISLDLSQDQTAGTVEIMPLFKLRANLSQASCNQTNLEVSIASNTPAGFLLAVRAKDNLPVGVTVAQVTVRSADTNDLPCYVSVFIHNPPDLDLMPARLSFEAQAGPQTRILWLKQHGPAPLTLLDAIAPSDKFHCEIDPDPSGFNYRIYVTAWEQDNGAAAGGLKLRLQSAGGAETNVVVPVLVGGR